MQYSRIRLLFFDLETDSKAETVLDIGAVKEDGSVFGQTSLEAFLEFASDADALVGHNIIAHDLKVLASKGYSMPPGIDTLYLSSLLFPKRPYHRLVKDDKLQSDSLNNPLNDAKTAMHLFYDEVNVFNKLDPAFQEVLFHLLKDQDGFAPFFTYLGISFPLSSIKEKILRLFDGKICGEAELERMLEEDPVSLAFALAQVHADDRHSIPPPWLLANFPQTDRLMTLLRGRPCGAKCRYCREKYDAHRGLLDFFGHEEFRSYGGVPLQEKAVQTAIEGKSLLAIFPTGGGKSITFQLPALMAGEAEKALTVVISPLQSLMKDQVDNLEKIGITDAVTINGLLDPIERAKAFERVEEGTACLLYISPESLRSKTIEKLLLGRKISRFVIDEAHCFSSWGHDFRIDYLYIGDFIRQLERKKRLALPIPVSCFTATAKPQVVEDIRAYFKSKLFQDLILFQAAVGRTNLHYQVVEKKTEEEKYHALRHLLEAKQCPSIIYVSRTRKAFLLAEKLQEDGFLARAYHGKMDKQEKTENQNAFISGEVQIMVATSAFGMGVDKKDVKLVVHYDISDSLENYIQEAGRAGRDEQIEAECYVLYSEEDLNKHFILLNQTKVTLKEIQQIWKAIKDLTRYRSQVSNSALEIARKAGWDDNIDSLENRVTTAIAALEESGYLRRGQNMPRIFASSIQSPNADEAIRKITDSNKFSIKQKGHAIRIIKKLFSAKSRQKAQEEDAESRVDYIADHLGIVKEEVIQSIQLLREEGILADSKDLQAFIKQNDRLNKSMEIVDHFGRIENYLLPRLMEETQVFNLKNLNEEALQSGIEGMNPAKLRTVLNFWGIKNWIKRRASRQSKYLVEIALIQSKDRLKENFRKRHILSKFIVEYLFGKANTKPEDLPLFSNQILVEFSVLELQEAFSQSGQLFDLSCTHEEVEDALFFLSRIEAIKIEGGFLVIYNRLTLERKNMDNKVRFKQEDYRKLEDFYLSKTQQIHIVGEYANKMITDYKAALRFVEDYFQLNYSAFLFKYFKGAKQQEINRNISPGQFKRLFGELSPGQLSIINDQESKHILVAAGPGSGKTRILAHKLASLILMENFKYEQLLMLTFSRAAVTEFTKRLMSLIGNAALFVDIKTFHGYCFDILGKVGSLEKSADIILQATEKIRAGEVEVKEATRLVLVIDEAQDINAEEYALLQALMERNEEMRVIAVGDDDQNIFEFRGADARYLREFVDSRQAKTYELVENFRSKSNLVECCNQWINQLTGRLKHIPIQAKDTTEGEIRMTQYVSPNLIEPMVRDILQTDLKGSIGVLTRTNEEALKLAGALKREGLPIKLIQTNDQFHLPQLVEIRFFLQKLKSISDGIKVREEDWSAAKEALHRAYGGSSKYELISKMIAEFETIRPKARYLSDVEEFFAESRIEDFYHPDMETILVSTIHKAKGREFDRVFMLLASDKPMSEADIRLVYVGMTRSKQFLSIHFRGGHFQNIPAALPLIQKDPHAYQDPETLILHLNHRDVWLNYFLSRQRSIKNLKPGDILFFTDDSCQDKYGHSVLKFSNAFKDSLKEFSHKGYILQSIRVNWMLYWKDAETQQEGIIILPELELVRQQN